MKVTLTAITQPVIKKPDGSSMTADELIVYAARVSNPSNQMNTETGGRLLKFCLRNKHWSVFETASMTVEIQTSRAIAAQILRHRSFTFQEFSLRYSTATEYEYPEFRMKGSTNRQGSIQETAPPDLEGAARSIIEASFAAYDLLIKCNVAPECARMILPLCTRTTLYMTGNARSWIHYLEQRTSAHAQKEHRLVALEIEKIFNEQFPSVAEAMRESKSNESTPAH